MPSVWHRHHLIWYVRHILTISHEITITWFCRVIKWGPRRLSNFPKDTPSYAWQRNSSPGLSGSNNHIFYRIKSLCSTTDFKFHLFYKDFHDQTPWALGALYLHLHGGLYSSFNSTCVRLGDHLCTCLLGTYLGVNCWVIGYGFAMLFKWVKHDVD